MWSGYKGSIVEGILHPEAASFDMLTRMRFALAFVALSLGCSAATMTVYRPMVYEGNFSVEYCSHEEFCGPNSGSVQETMVLPSVTFDSLGLPAGSTITSARLSYYSHWRVPMITDFTEAYGPLCAEPCDWSGGRSTETVYADAQGTINGESWFSVVNPGDAETTGIYPDSSALVGILQAGQPVLVDTTLFAMVGFPQDGSPRNNWTYYKADWLVRLNGNWELTLDYEAPPVTPVPEPGTLSVLAAEVGSLIAVRSIRRRGY